MTNTKSHRIGFYILIAVAVAAGWIVASGIALYIRGAQLLTILPEEQARQDAAFSADITAARDSLGNEARRSFHTPPLLHLGPCTQGIPQPAAISARSAVVMDAASGALLFEKNPDQSIPPASLTKLVAMYTVMLAVERGEIS